MQIQKQQWPCRAVSARCRSERPSLRLSLYTGLFMLPMLAESALAGSAVTADLMHWQLQQGSVVNQGESVALPQGTLRRGFVIQAKAKSADPRFVPQGTLDLTLSAFTPNVDLPGQTAGNTYVQGKWTLTDAASTGSSKHSQGIISGSLHAELDTDPLLDPVAWSAKAVLPMSTVTPVGSEGLQWARGVGQLNLNAELEGELELTLDLWPSTAVVK